MLFDIVKPTTPERNRGFGLCRMGKAMLDKFKQEINTMAIKTFTVTAPSFWASYYVNGDASGLEDEEIKAADEFHDWLAKNEPNLSCVDAEDAGFIGWHDAFEFYSCGSDCSTYTFMTVEADIILEEITQ